MDDAFLHLLKDLIKPNSVLDPKILNEKIVFLFPKKEFLENKKVKNYFNHLVSYMMSIIAKKNLEKALKLLDIIYKRLYDSNLSTLDGKFSKEIRVPLIKRFGRNSEEHKLSKKLAKLSYEDKGIVIQEAKDSLIDRMSEIIRYDSQQIFTIIQKGLKSENAYEKAVSLALASGCRPVELFDKQVQFEIIDDHWVIQNFVAKKRGLIVPVKKPIVGMDTKIFIEQIDDMRYFISSETRNLIKNGELNKTVESRANDTAKKIFNHQTGITMYSCRKIYSDLSFSLFAKNSIYGTDPTIALWRSKVLAHGDGDVTTQNHYSNFQAESVQMSPLELSEIKAKVDRLEVLIGEKKLVEKPTIISTKDAKRKEQFGLIGEMYEAKDIKPTQTEMEQLLKGKVPRAMVRLWYKENS